MLRTLGLSLRLDRARLLHAHAPGRHSGLALEASEGRRRRAAAEAHRQRAHPSCCRAAGRTGSRGSGKAEKVEGGYRITARKVFTSGAPTGDLLMTGAVLESRGEPPMVLHFGMPMNSPHVKVLDTWRTLGMRGTGSHDVLIEGHVVPEAAVAREAQGRRVASAVPDHRDDRLPADLLPSISAWPRARATSPSAWPSSKQPEPAHDRSRRPHGDGAGRARGLRTSRCWRPSALNAPSADDVNQVMIGRQLVARHAIAAVELAMELAGGAGFYRAAGLERRFRDIQAARYHPLQSGPQAEYAGAMALGLPVDRIF